MKSDVFLGLLKTKGKNVDWLVKKMNEEGETIVRSTIYKKLRGESEFQSSQIKAISKILKLTNKEMLDIFFEELVS
ncbi:hypothetical protein [Lactococcus lactis]|uniref:hypothetical protein n=1 Tax=Lactococcus lactis TaxID=1358 RepID=UPI0024A90383|nr:hypothetical protein [Lactococcus lactis]